MGTALEALEDTRTEWDSYDLSYEDAHIEVKYSAYLQSWPQSEPSTAGEPAGAAFWQVPEVLDEIRVGEVRVPVLCGVADSRVPGPTRPTGSRAGCRYP